MVARSTLGFTALAVTLAIAAALGWRPQETAPRTLLAVEEAEIEAVTITRGEQTLAFERRAEGWQMLQPEVAPAEAGAVVFLLNVIATETSDKQLLIAPEEASAFGFEAPLAAIDIATGSETRTLILGDYDFSNQSIYALVDPEIPSAETPEATVPVHLVSPNFDLAVSRPLEEWKADSSDAPAAPSTPEQAAPAP